MKDRLTTTKVDIPRQDPATIKHNNMNTIKPDEELIPLVTTINTNYINIKISIIIKNTR